MTTFDPAATRPLAPSAAAVSARPSARATATAAPRPRVLILTKVFPNAREPLAAAFNRQQFAALTRHAHVEVVAPVPWFPGAQLFGARTGAGRLHAVPAFEWIDGLFVRHPRVLHLPRLDYAAAPTLYAVALRSALPGWRGRFDVVLGSFLYPDGVAAVALARRLGVPAVLYALGSDVNVVPGLTGVRPQLARALGRAGRVVAVSRDLAERVVGLGAPADRVVVVPNGVDPKVFFPRDRAQARRDLGAAADERWILFVGRLEPGKGIDELLRAFRALAPAHPTARLVLVGEGSLRVRCEMEAAGFPGRIRVVGGRPLAEVATYMAAADVVTLPSHAEGTPNVVLEALASGRKVVATRVGGIPDLIAGPTQGVLVPVRDADALAGALGAALGDPGDPAAIAAAGPVSWDESADRLADVLRVAIAEARR